MIKKISLGLILFLGLGQVSRAQEEERKVVLSPDVHFRTFWMNTRYPQADFKEDYALGMSLNLGAKLQFSNYWKFQVGYRFFGNVSSSDIWNPDPVSGQSNRYETGLFDLQNPADRFFGKLETLSLTYSRDKFGVQAGRMGINSDWINAQDGRLSPTYVEGLNLWFIPDSRWKLAFWGIGRMSIRGSSRWLGVGETLGLYPQGRTAFGKPGNYLGNTSSDWLAIVEVDRKFGKSAKLHFSNTLAQNLFSTYWLALETKAGKNTGMFQGVQLGLQHGIGNGGNEDPALRYKNPEDVNFALSARLGWKNTRWTTHLSATQVGGNGRWLSPREWGKDAWYTFIPRERNEGFEHLTAVVAYGEYRLPKAPIQLYAHMGIHWLPDTQDAAANKYNFPSYRQLNLGLKYQPKQVKNLDFHLILVNKEPLNSEGLTPNQIYNKVEMWHFNGVLNWRWN